MMQPRGSRVPRLGSLGIGLAGAALWVLGACSSSDDSSSSSADTVGDTAATLDVADASGAEVLGAWNETGTGGVPTYGNCRFTTGEHFAVASNGEADDVLQLAIDDSGSGTLTIRVRDALSVKLEGVELALQRGLRQESYRRMKGTAVWGAQSGNVIDGMLCFDNRLTVGVDAKAELTLILENADGDRFAATGRFVASGAGIDLTDGVKVSLDAVDIDLR